MAQFLIRAFRGDGLCGSQFEDTVHHGGESLAAGREAAGHGASAVGKQRETKTVLSLRSSLYSVLDSCPGNRSFLLCSAFLEILLQTHKGVFPW